MNILYLCDEYPPGRHGGIGTSIKLMARQMVKLGHNVVVAGLYNLGYGGEDQFSDMGVKVFRFRRGFDSKIFCDETSLLSRIAIRVLMDLGLMEKDIKKSLARYHELLEEIIATHHIDIVEMPDYNDYTRFCRSFVPFPALSVPVIVKLNGSITYFTKEAHQHVPEHVFKMEQAILMQAAAVSAASKYVADKSAAYFSYPGEMEILYNSIDTNISVKNTPKIPDQVIFTGTLVAKKGIYQLARAWNIVNKKMPGARLLILGKGSQRKVLSFLTASAKATVSFMGHVDTDKLCGYLAGASVSVFPSYSEAFALAPLESIACGTTVINSNRTSGPELIEHKITGLLVNPDDTHQMASAILYLLNNPEVCQRLAKSGLEKVKRQFDINGIAIKNMEFYVRVLNKSVAN